MIINKEEIHYEYWDILDKQRNRTGIIHKRGEPFPENAYHLVVSAWVVDSNGRFLIQRRSLSCGWMPGIWGTPGGSVLSGEDSLTGVIRETKEEAGISLDPKNAELFCSFKYSNAFFDHWLFIQDFDLSDVILQEGETMDARAATCAEICNMKERGEFIGRKVWNHNFDAFDLLKERFNHD